MANPAVNTDFQIATTLGGLTTLYALGITNPFPIYKPGVQAIKLGDNSARTLGSPLLEWHWGFLSQSQRDTLRTYIPGASAPLYIITPTTENIAGDPNAAQTYFCQAWWPAPNTPEAPQNGRRLEFVLTFKQLAVQT